MRATNRPKPYGGQLDRCQVCGDKYHRENLVRTPVEFLQGEGSNLFTNSTYNGIYWVVDTSSDEGEISYGVHKDEARTSVSDDNVVSVVNGVQTWEGSGTLRSTSPSSTLDPGSYATFSLWIGPYERNTSPSMSIDLGITNSDGSSGQKIRTWNINGDKRIWFTEAVATLSAAGLGDAGEFYFYADVTNDGKWWADKMQLEQTTSSDAKPGTFVTSSGAATTYATDTAMVTNRKVCRRCFETVWKKSQEIGRTNESPVAPPVRPFSQEF